MKSFFALVTILLLSIVLTACGSSASAKEDTVVGDPVAGETLFMSACKSCHGPDAQGLPGRGKNLVTSEFVGAQNDQDLVEFLKVGRPADDPLNTTGVRMPAMGPKRGLTDQDLYNIVAYLRTLRQP
jgi:mono/diheme cytochrome c family protein